MVKQENFLTNAPENKEATVENGTSFPNLKNVAGDSVDELKELEEANIIITGDEIKQQNENL